MSKQFEISQDQLSFIEISRNATTKNLLYNKQMQFSIVLVLSIISVATVLANFKTKTTKYFKHLLPPFYWSTYQIVLFFLFLK